jgi:hypothetical protein
MSRLIGTGKTTKQRLASYALTPSQLPRLLLARCMSVHVGGLQELTGFCCRSAVCKRPRLRSMLAMPRCRPHKGTYSPIVTRHSWPHRRAWRCMMRAAAARGTGNSSLDDTRQNSLGTRHGSVLQLSSRPCPLGSRCFYFSSSVSSVSEWSPACATTATQTHGHRPHLAAKHEKHRAGWLSRPAIFVSACVCALRGESTCARAGLNLTVRLV